MSAKRVVRRWSRRADRRRRSRYGGAAGTRRAARSRTDRRELQRVVPQPSRSEPATTVRVGHLGDDSSKAVVARGDGENLTRHSRRIPKARPGADRHRRARGRRRWQPPSPPASLDVKDTCRGFPVAGSRSGGSRRLSAAIPAAANRRAVWPSGPSGEAPKPWAENHAATRRYLFGREEPAAAAGTAGSEFNSRLVDL